ncbi:hypothetical protein C2S53_010341 [Perilla frutescens var. hirtella]|uniref:Telomerase reverse transcriptase n=1 Tax=Perilla frutescens var. hirtella TaxID=608512 RepID=A0AAD4IZW9_PERFH|nr:hypothetical protein C2S53_010341 [Perilla frutescens var. hirtella]
MTTGKRKRVPEVLWRLFGRRARTLADTIIALIPTPPPHTVAACRCEGRRCLSCCGGEEAKPSFLVRSGDSSDYHTLLTGCFVVVSEHAPPVPVYDPHCRWPQLEIVRRLIEIMLREQPSSSNLICSGYDRERRSSAAVDELTSAKWTILLRRIGDALMMYLLKYTSIFLPLSRKKHHQISGCPIGDLCSKFSGPKSGSQHHQLAHKGYEIKRKRVEGDEVPRKQLCTDTLGSETCSNSASLATIDGSTSTYVSEEIPHKQSEGNSKQNNLMSQKRTRPYRWQRQRKRRQLAVQGMPSLIPCNGNSCTSDNVPLFSNSSQSDMGNISHCFCCSVFQNEPRMKGNAEIDRKNIFYKLENSSSMLPSKHILHTLKPNGSGASILFHNIFEAFGPDKNAGSIACCHKKDGCPNYSTCLYHSLAKLLKSLIRESQNCRHVRLLEKHCPMRSSNQDSSRGAGIEPEGNDSAKHLSMSRQDGVQSEGKMSQVANAKNWTETTTAQVEPIKCCLKNEVVSFIWAICRRIVPSPLLGEPSNWRVLRRNIAKFIQLRKFEKFTLKECTHKLKISKFPIFSNKLTGCSGVGVTDIARHAILDCWMLWVFVHLVSPLVQANFYVTESEHEKKEMLYYRKSTWEKMMREGEFMTDDGYCQLNHKSVRNILGNRSFGYSRARLLPKHKGFRMLTNLRAPSRLPVNTPSSSRIHSNPKSQRMCNHRGAYRFFKSVNSVLQDVHAVLKGLREKKPGKLGSSVFDYNDVYKKLVPFLLHLKNGSANLPNVFMVVSDVSKAFDSVNHDKLLSVMSDVISEDEFTLEKFTQVICTRKSVKSDQHLMLAHHDNIVPASSSIRSRLRTQSSGSVAVKKEVHRKVRKEEMKSILKEHITRNVVQVGNEFYLQRVGIPHGSIVSSLLCSFYYGDMERNVVYPYLEKSSGEYLLLRFIDDFFFISTSKRQASMFFSRLERGVSDYNCCMNEEKYGLNFTMDINGQSNRVVSSEDGTSSFIGWSGLLVNCSTLEIRADYTRYVNSRLSSTLTVSCQGRVGRQLKAKLKSYLRPKCHPIFYDSNINSPGVVRLNIYQVFLLCAMKFICSLSNLSSILPRFDPKFCVDAIETSVRYMNRLIKRKMCSFKVEAEAGAAAVRPRYNVTKREVMWLGLYAYSRALKKKQSRYSSLLRLLRWKLKAYEAEEAAAEEEVDKKKKKKMISSHLKFAVDDVHSSALWSIKY